MLAAAIHRAFVGLLPVALALGTCQAAEPEASEFFENRVRPLLVEHCHGCHSRTAKKVKGGLLLDSRDATLKGGDTGPAVVPGKPADSKLVKAIGYQNVDLRMPPRGKLPERAIADLTAWIAMGSPWPADRVASAPRATAAGFDLAARKATHWAWQPVRARPAPSVSGASWPLGQVDGHILAKLEAKRLPPAPAADKRTLLRRLYFALLGLPPTPAEVREFLDDATPSATEKVVDRLLASPHFGERWARHWLDLVRYGESRGHEFDFTAPNAYQYRDYVIRALNADVPYDRFVLENIAGDLLQPPRLHPTEGFDESVLGTGFWYLGEQVHSPVDLRQDEADRLDNMVDVFSKTFLGLTVACARCHDHKFDAISTKDYYALLGFLQSSSYRQICFDTHEHNRRVAQELWALRERQRPALQRAVADALRPGIGKAAAYLLASRDLIRKPRTTGGQDRDEVGNLARTRNLDADKLERWSAHLRRAVNESSDPLHAWAKLSLAPAPSVFPALVQSLRKRNTEALGAISNEEVVADYRATTPPSWITDGPLFGAGPVRPGMISWGDDPSKPLRRVYDYGAAEKDGAWERLREAPGVEREPGALGGQLRAGRTLRTPRFTIKTGKLFYLVRGAGKAFASVNSHVMISGPLHAKLVHELSGGEGFQWSAHDLSMYVGQRVHIEFTPATNADFGVALVVQGNRPPTRIEPANPLLLRLLTENENASEEKLAAAFQRLLLDSVQRLGQDRILDAADTVAHAGLANWVVQHQDLFLAADARQQLAAATRSLLEEQKQVVAKLRPESHTAPAIVDANGVDEHVFIRGSPRALGPLVQRRFLEALAGPEPLAIAQGSGRLKLARQVVDPERNPFIARVAVNRIWHHLFGRGIVASVDNFGGLGEPPSHPELLDSLADQLVRDGWSIKKLIRTLVLSRTYQMSANPHEDGDAADPGNVLLHRMNIRRLEGEAIRDAILHVSGRADLRPFGPAVPIHLTPFQDGRGRPASGPLDGNGRRSLYLAVRRNFISPFLLAFDTPIPFSTVGRRTVSNVPAQALILMNDPFVHQQAEVWAKEILAEPLPAAERIAAMYEAALARPPSAAELKDCLDFLQRQGPQAPEGLGPWTDLAHVIFNTKEFIYLN